MKILFVSNNIPPINSSASVRNLSLIQGLVKIGCKVHLLTTDPKENFINYDSSLSKLLPTSVEMYRCPVGKIFSRNISKKDLPKQSDKKPLCNLRKVFRNFLKDLFFFPDANAEWRKTWKVFKDALTSFRFDAVVSSSDSKTSHYIASAALDLINHKPFWIQIWGDPWSMDISSSMIRHFQGALCEKQIMAKADRVMFVSNPTFKAYCRKYKNLTEKMSFLGRSYVEMKDHDKCELGNENTEAVQKEIELLYSGNINSKSRDILPLLAALNKYNSANANKLRLNIYGSCSSDIRELIDSFEEVRYFGTKPFAELLSIMHSENYALIFIANKSGNQIPGKLFDYLGTNSPIMAIVEEKDNPVAEFVKSLNRCFVAKNNTASILSVIKDLLRYPDKHSLEPMNDFSPENIARKLLKVVSEEKEGTRS